MQNHDTIHNHSVIVYENDCLYKIKAQTLLEKLFRLCRFILYILVTHVAMIIFVTFITLNYTKCAKQVHIIALYQSIIISVICLSILEHFTHNPRYYTINKRNCIIHYVYKYFDVTIIIWFACYISGICILTYSGTNCQFKNLWSSLIILLMSASGVCATFMYSAQSLNRIKIFKVVMTMISIIATILLINNKLVFTLVLTIISSFVSISILTIHWIEHSNNKWNYYYRSSLLIKFNKNRKYTPSQRTIIRLTWSIIIIFCTICIVCSLFIISQLVTRLNEVQIIVCNAWTARVLASFGQFGVGLMHCLFVAHLYEIYRFTDFAYSSFIIRVFCLILVNLTIGLSVILFLYLDVDEYNILWLNQQYSTCNVEVPMFLNIIVGGTELVVTLLLIYLFVWPMNKMIRIHKSSRNDIEYPKRVIFQVHKITTLALVATISTFLCSVVISWTNAIWPVFINMPLNCICLMFMTPFYPNGYKKICCLSTRLGIRLFKHATKKQLRSQNVYHASHQSSVLPLNDITTQGLQKKYKETDN
eukprot:16092_1